MPGLLRRGGVQTTVCTGDWRPGRFEGAVPVFQGDNAGPHPDANFHNCVREHCQSKSWHWEPQAPHMHSLDLAVFQQLAAAALKQDGAPQQLAAAALKQDGAPQQLAAAALEQDGAEQRDKRSGTIWNLLPL
jgi:hypothetical protein